MKERSYRDFIEKLWSLKEVDSARSFRDGCPPHLYRVILGFGHEGKGWPTESKMVEDETILKALEKKREKLEKEEEERKRLGDGTFTAKPLKSGIEAARARLGKNIDAINEKIYFEYVQNQDWPVFLLRGFAATAEHHKYRVYFIFNPDAVKEGFLKWSENEGRGKVSQVRNAIASVLLRDNTSEEEKLIGKHLYITPKKKSQKPEAPQHHDKQPNMPRVPEYYVERPELFELLKGKVLAPVAEIDCTTAGITAIYGGPGMGKSLLLAQLAWEPDVNQKFDAGVTHINLREPGLSLQAAQSLLAYRFQAGQLSFPSVQDGRTSLQSLSEGKKHLVLLDNVTAKASIEAFTLLSPQCHILFTCQNADLARTYDPRAIEISALPTLKDLELLQKASRQSISLSIRTVSDILSHCQGHPLGLALVGAMVSVSKMKWETVWECLKEPCPREVSAILKDYEFPNLYAAIHASVQAVQNDAARERYLELAVLPYDTPVSPNALETIWGVTPHKVDRTLRMLCGTCLATTDADGSLVLHNLLLDYLIARAGNRLQGLYRQTVENYRKRCVEGRWHLGPADGHYFQYLPHYLRGAGLTDVLYQILTETPDWGEACLTKTGGVTTYWDELNRTIEGYAVAQDPRTIRELAILFFVKQISFCHLLCHNIYDIQALVWLDRVPEALAAVDARKDPHWQFEALSAFVLACRERGLETQTHLPRLIRLALALGPGLGTKPSSIQPIETLLSIGATADAYTLASSIRVPLTKAIALLKVAEAYLTMRPTADANETACFAYEQACACIRDWSDIEEESLRLGVSPYECSYWIAQVAHRLGNLDHVRAIYDDLDAKTRSAHPWAREFAWAAKNALLLFVFAEYPTAERSIRLAMADSKATRWTREQGERHLAQLAVLYAQTGVFDRAQVLVDDLPRSDYTIPGIAEVAVELWKAGRQGESQKLLERVLPVPVRGYKRELSAAKLVSCVAMAYCRIGLRNRAELLLAQRHALASRISGAYSDLDVTITNMAESLASIGHADRALKLCGLGSSPTTPTAVLRAVIPYVQSAQTAKRVERMLRRLEARKSETDYVEFLFLRRSLALAQLRSGDQKGFDQTRQSIEEMAARQRDSVPSLRSTRRRSGKIGIARRMARRIDTRELDRLITRDVIASLLIAQLVAQYKVTEALSIWTSIEDDLRWECGLDIVTSVVNREGIAQAEAILSTIIQSAKASAEFDGEGTGAEPNLLEIFMALDRWDQVVGFLEKTRSTKNRAELCSQAGLRATESKQWQQAHRLMVMALLDHEENTRMGGLYIDISFLIALQARLGLFEEATTLARNADTGNLLLNLSIVAREAYLKGRMHYSMDLWTEIACHISGSSPKPMCAKWFSTFIGICLDLAKVGRIASIFKLQVGLDQHGMMEFVAQMLPAIESIEKGLGLTILGDCVRILSWYPEFDELRLVVSRCLEMKEGEGVQS